MSGAPAIALVLALLAIAVCRAEDKPAAKPSPLDRLEGRPGDVVASFSGERVEAVAFSPDGKWLASSDTRENVVIRDTANLEKPVVLKAGPKLTLLELAWSEPTNLCHCLAFSPDSRVLALALSKSIELWDLGDAKPAKSVTFEPGLVFMRSIAFSPDGKTLAITGDEHAVHLWDLGGDKPRQRATIGEVTLSATHLAFAPDGKSLAVASAEVPAEPSLLAPATGAVTICDPVNEKQLAKIEGLKSAAICVAYSTDGQTLAVASMTHGREPSPKLRLYDVRGSQPKEGPALIGHWSEARFVAFSADGKTLVSAGWDGRVILWDAATGKMIREVKKFQTGIYYAALAPDGRHLAAGFRSGNIHIVRLR